MNWIPDRSIDARNAFLELENQRLRNQLSANEVSLGSYEDETFTGTRESTASETLGNASHSVIDNEHRVETHVVQLPPNLSQTLFSSSTAPAYNNATYYGRTSALFEEVVSGPSARNQDLCQLRRPSAKTQLQLMGEATRQR